MTKAKQMFQQMHQRQKERNASLMGEVQRCQQNCVAMEQENDKLKQAIALLLQRFAQLGEIFSGSELAHLASTSSAPGTPPLLSAPKAGAQAKNPPTSPPGIDNAEAQANAAIPSLPEFPLLSFSEALCGTPQGPSFRTPLSLAQMLTPQTCSSEGGLLPSSWPAVAPSLAMPPSGMLAASVFQSAHFSFQLRKADGADLGLNVQSVDQVLRVEGIRAGGAVEAWNRQCAGGPTAEKVVLVGDKIISVNGVSYDPQKMLEECRDRQLLKITIVRGDRPMPAPVTLPAKACPPTAADASISAARAAAAKKMNVNASVFVPILQPASEAPAAPVTGAEAETGGRSADADGAAGKLVLTEPALASGQPAASPSDAGRQ